MIFIDEGHRIDKASLDTIIDFARKWRAPIIISYDFEAIISEDERRRYGAEIIETLPGFVRFKLTNRIRLNSELSSFISCVMCAMHKFHRRMYPSVSVSYAVKDEEAYLLIQKYISEGYVYIWDKEVDGKAVERISDKASLIETSDATCKEFDKVLMYIDESFTYNQDGYIVCTDKSDKESDDFRIRNLFHGLSRAKNNIALVVKNNEEVINVLLAILQ